jgi:hypothetical protein
MRLLRAGGLARVTSSLPPDIDGLSSAPRKLVDVTFGNVYQLGTDWTNPVQLFSIGAFDNQEGAWRVRERVQRARRQQASPETAKVAGDWR